MQVLEVIEGTVWYRYPVSHVDEGGSRSLLAIDVPPHGHVQQSDIRAARRYLQDVLRVPEGGSLRIQGFRHELGGVPLVLIVRVLDVAVQEYVA